MSNDEDAYTELSYYTIAHPGPDFIHQHAVDTIAAQTADANTKPIRLAFALVGLYLHVEKNVTGRQVQQVHTRLSQKKQDWPAFALPAQRGSLTVTDVLAAPPGAERDRMIHAWCAAVWQAYASNRAQVIDLLRRNQVEG